MIRPLAIQRGTTELGSRYTLSQNGPTTIQITIQRGDYLISETFHNLRSEQEMLENRDRLEQELLQWVNNNGNETNQPVLRSGTSAE